MSATPADLAALYEQWKWTGHEHQLHDTGGKFPGIDRALRHLPQIQWAGLALALWSIGDLDQERLDQKNAGEEARAKLREAAGLLRQAGCEKIADLAEDLGACAAYAGAGEVLAQPYNIRTSGPLTVDDWRDMRLYLTVLPDANANMLARAKPKGRSKNNPEAAKNGAAVRMVAHFFTGADDQFGVIAGLLKDVGVIVPHETVRRILTGYKSTKPTIAPKSVDLLSCLPRPKQ